MSWQAANAQHREACAQAFDRVRQRLRRTPEIATATPQETVRYLMRELCCRGWTCAGVAKRMHVSLSTAKRWRAGTSIPHGVRFDHLSCFARAVMQYKPRPAARRSAMAQAVLAIRRRGLCNREIARRVGRPRTAIHHLIVGNSRGNRALVASLLTLAREVDADREAIETLQARLSIATKRHPRPRGIVSSANNRGLTP